jgi:hypothetical protein
VCERSVNAHTSRAALGRDVESWKESILVNNIQEDLSQRIRSLEKELQGDGERYRLDVETVRNDFVDVRRLTLAPPASDTK